jgi:hypothetical protein
LTSIVDEAVALGSYPSVFIDVPGNWAEDAINALAFKGYVHGFPGNIFKPNSFVTRAEFVVILSNAFATGASSGTTASFVDVPANAWYAKKLAWAIGRSLVVGISANRFGPSTEISREQVAVFVRRYAESFNIPLADMRVKTLFADDRQISPYAAASVYKLQTAGLISPKPGNLYDPKGKATRAEVADIVYRLLEKGGYFSASAAQ